MNLTLRPAAEMTTWVSQTAAAELALANPFVEDQSHLRPTLIMGLLDTLLLNQSSGVAASRLFETGGSFVENNGQNYEAAAVAFAMAEDPAAALEAAGAAGFLRGETPCAPSRPREAIDLECRGGRARGGPGFGWQEGHSVNRARWTAGWIARFGLVNLSLLRARGIEGSVLAGVFAILPADAGRPGREDPARGSSASSRRPCATSRSWSTGRPGPGDVQGSRGADRRGRGRRAFGVEAVEVFDVYEGKGLPEGKKSLAVSLVFRSPSRTLTDDEVNARLQRIQDEVRHERLPAPQVSPAVPNKARPQPGPRGEPRPDQPHAPRRRSASARSWATCSPTSPS
jgi:phenylalanyl-tRNA synthetase beta chain